MKGGSETVDEQVEKKGRKNSALRNAESTQGGETEPPRRTWDRVPHRKLASKCQRDPVTPEIEETNKSFDPAGVESFFDVSERGKGVLMAAQAQGVHEAEGHGVGTPAEAALGRVEFWKDVGAMRAMERWESREVGSPSRLMTGTTKLDFQVEGTTALQDQVEEGKQKMALPWE